MLHPSSRGLPYARAFAGPFSRPNTCRPGANVLRYHQLPRPSQDHRCPAHVPRHHHSTGQDQDHRRATPSDDVVVRLGPALLLAARGSYPGPSRRRGLGDTGLDAIGCGLALDFVTIGCELAALDIYRRAATNLSGIPLDLVRQYLRNRQLEHRFQRQVLGLEMELELQFLRHVDKENSLQLTIDLLRETRKRCRQLRTKAKTAKPMAKADGRPWRRSKQLLARHRKVEPAKPGAERIAAEEKPVEPVEHDAPGSPSTGGPSNAEPEREPLPGKKSFIPVCPSLVRIANMFVVSEVPVAALEKEEKRSRSARPGREIRKFIPLNIITSYHPLLIHPSPSSRRTHPAAPRQAGAVGYGLQQARPGRYEGSTGRAAHPALVPSRLAAPKAIGFGDGLQQVRPGRCEGSAGRGALPAGSPRPVAAPEAHDFRDAAEQARPGSYESSTGRPALPAGTTRGLAAAQATGSGDGREQTRPGRCCTKGSAGSSAHPAAGSPSRRVAAPKAIGFGDGCEQTRPGRCCTTSSSAGRSAHPAGSTRRLAPADPSAGCGNGRKQVRTGRCIIRSAGRPARPASGGPSSRLVPGADPAPSAGRWHGREQVRHGCCESSAGSSARPGSGGASRHDPGPAPAPSAGFRYGREQVRPGCCCTTSSAGRSASSASGGRASRLVPGSGPSAGFRRGLEQARSGRCTTSSAGC
ncbi:hypothetical protein EV356DRAFT_496792 [Viridothelium virens]|uniref:Uncharacterized protein n=1 Tax=Viridothelium virens TaxID=1048519 RepID=A0A6A6HI62_VIRVR|nr:hypothetical protein EV356DRAFT_496792 [Viridothelium virens]